MNSDVIDISWVDEHLEFSLAELAARSRLAEAELLELVACGVIAPRAPAAERHAFSGHALALAQTAARLRADFELDLRGTALALTLIARIDALQQELARLRAHAPG